MVLCPISLLPKPSRPFPHLLFTSRPTHRLLVIGLGSSISVALYHVGPSLVRLVVSHSIWFPAPVLRLTRVAPYWLRSHPRALIYSPELHPYASIWSPKRFSPCSFTGSNEVNNFGL